LAISRLALWLHTARGDHPLSSLDENIREGNSLICSDFYKGQINLAFYDQNQKERVNAFDWRAAFPAVFARGGFDAVVGNPPYVKFQNFRKVHADMAMFLREGRPQAGIKPYASTQTGNFDLYLPFIEKGITLLNDQGRLGYIAPSLWTTNEYGEGLRKLIARGRNLAGWIDFKAYQVFDESITYTALQFFTRAPNKAIRVADAPTGTIPNDPWAGVGRALPYGREEFGERWLLLTGKERTLIDRLYQRFKYLRRASNERRCNLPSPPARSEELSLHARWRQRSAAVRGGDRGCSNEAARLGPGSETLYPAGHGHLPAFPLSS
jgi:Eco57I restriction-modification methylase